MKKLTIDEIYTKYKHIEDKIPTIWKTYELAGIELSQDICFHWNIKNNEIIRVISVINMYVKGFNLYKHIDQRFTYAGLYPHIQKTYNIFPE